MTIARTQLQSKGRRPSELESRSLKFVSCCASCTVQDAEDPLRHPEGLMGFSWELTASSARGRHKMAKRHQKMRSQGRSVPQRFPSEIDSDASRLLPRSAREGWATSIARETRNWG